MRWTLRLWNPVRYSSRAAKSNVISAGALVVVVLRFLKEGGGIVVVVVVVGFVGYMRVV
jgi:hypothetical protein